MKKNRHDKIIEIIDTYDVETQEQLASLLRQAGYDVTQATVSRDIRELALTKVPNGKGKQKYGVMIQGDYQLKDKYIQVLRNGFLSMDVAENLLVMKTVSGMAMAVAAAIDNMHLKEVLGCIAGDDTIFVASRGGDDALALMNQVREMLKS